MKKQKTKIFNRYLVSQNEPKLKLIAEEQGIYKKILFSLKLNENETESNLVKTYQSFLDKIKEHKISGTELFRIISKIQFMAITTDKSEISTRELYQALNNSKDNSQINLISDFITQKDESAGIAWQKTVNFYKDSGHYGLMEDFIKDFLTIQNDGKIPNKNALYNNFKSYFSKISKYKTLEEIIKNIHQYAGYYLKILNADFEDSEIKEQITILNENNGQDSYPYLSGIL